MLTLLLLLLMVGAPLNAHLTQQRNLRAVERHIAGKLRPMLGARLEFADVCLGGYTGGGGMLGVYGTVHSEAALKDLRRLVDESDPPVAVRWTVDLLRGGESPD